MSQLGGEPELSFDEECDAETDGPWSSSNVVERIEMYPEEPTGISERPSERAGTKRVHIADVAKELQEMGRMRKSGVNESQRMTAQELYPDTPYCKNLV